MSIEVLEKRPFGHNLKRLRSEAEKLGMDEPHRGTAGELEAVAILDALNIRHQQRYIETGPSISLPWDEAEQFAVRLHQKVAEKLGNKTLKRTYPVIRA